MKKGISSKGVKRMTTKKTLENVENVKKDFIDFEFGAGEAIAKGYDSDEVINYSPSFQKEFWKIWNKDTPAIIKKIQKKYPKDNKYKIEIDLLQSVDVDQTVRHGKYIE
jgi:hypothetical protein